jgi:meso-butanediol dehydrogenase / (S,S)-butanediol dehydrogenase / diacetyl reductase
MRLTDTVAVVTGGARDVGRGIALTLANAGANVAVVDLDSASDVVDEITRIGRMALAIKADVTRRDEVDKAVDKILQQFGNIDILVNNAGILRIGPVLGLREEEWDAMFNVNVKGVFLFSKAVAKHMTSRRKGKIVNIASEAGITGEALIVAYCASKFAVVGFTQAFALEMAPYNINVNAVCPTYVNTQLLDYAVSEIGKLESRSAEEVKAQWASDVSLGRLATPEDIAKVVLFLTSDDSSFISGQAINVTGGGARKYCVGG